MSDNHTGNLVLSPQFAQQLVQCLELFNNLDQYMNASNLVLSLALLHVI